MKLTVVGCGDAFGSGGRLQTCFHVETGAQTFLIDCGATAMIGMLRLGLDPNRVSTVFLTHLHGDHFAGLVWWLIHAVHVAKRTAPLAVTGPAGTIDRFHAAAEALFPGSTKTPRRFELTFHEYTTEQPLTVGGVTVTPYEVSHPSGATSYALRLAVDGKFVAFSGDTEWVDTLIPAAAGADLFIAECYGFDEPVRYHMSWRIIEANLPRLDARRVMLTHMNARMLANRSAVTDPRIVIAEDGMVIDV